MFLPFNLFFTNKLINHIFLFQSRRKKMTKVYWSVASPAQ